MPSFVRSRIYSGFGGQPDFVVGALHSDGGHAVVALPSWHTKSNSSTIVPRLVEPVTSFQHSAVVTEQGRAVLFGRSQRAQARLLISEVAHPDARAACGNRSAESPLVRRPERRARHPRKEANDYAVSIQLRKGRSSGVFLR